MLVCSLWIWGLTASSTMLAQNQKITALTYSLFDGTENRVGSQNTISDILFDKNEILWMATKSNLIQWNGQEKQIYDATGSEQLKIAGANFRKLFECNDSILLIEHQEGEVQLSLLNRHTQLSYPVRFETPDSLSDPGYQDVVFQTADDAVFAVRHHSMYLIIYEWKDTRFVPRCRVPFDYSMNKKKLRASFAYGYFWIAIEAEGIWKCNERESRKITDWRNDPEQQINTLSFLHTDRTGRLWLSRQDENNLYRWDKNSQKFTPVEHPFQSQAMSVQEDLLGNLLFVNKVYPANPSEVWLLNNNGWQDYSNLTTEQTLAFYPARDWNRSFFAATTTDVKIIKIQEEPVKSFLNKNPDNTEWGTIIKGINEDKNGNIYFLSEINGFYKLDKETQKITAIPIRDEHGKELTYQCGGVLLRDTEGYLWFKTCNLKTKGRLVRYHPASGSFRIYNFEELIRDIAIGADGHIWVTSHHTVTRHGKLTRFDTKTETFIPVPMVDEEGLSHFPEPRFCLYQQDTTVWIGTINGLIFADPKTGFFKSYTEENSSLTNDHIIVIHRDTTGRLLLGTYGGGIELFDPENDINQTFTKKEGLVNDFVCGILPVDHTHYWLTTFDGLSYWNMDLEKFVNTDRSQGLSHFEFNRYAYYQATDGYFYAGNVNGANRFKTEQLIGDSHRPVLGLGKFSRYYGAEDTLVVQKKQLDRIKTITIKLDVTYLQFNFYLTDFVGGRESQVFVRLDNYDEDWILLGKDKSIRYRNLPLGTYQLHVKGGSARGVPAVNKLQYTIVSLPVFYETWWFRLALLSGLVGLGYILAQWQFRLARRTKEKEQKIQQRFATLEMQALQAQLNPHFIFNALGAIQYYIQVNEVEAADIYLTRFAKLMRNYLDSSKEKTISLNNEIELLRNYTELELLRFERAFSVGIHTHTDLAEEDTHLPSMLIQPFVENAIHHGLSPRQDGNGKLNIHFYNKKNALYCEIRDNGIGRKNAKVNKRKGHKSRGMDIIREKIQTIELSGMAEIDISIEDFHPTNSKYPGTVVRLRIAGLEN